MKKLLASKKVSIILDIASILTGLAIIYKAGRDIKKTSKKE
jgi:hypothetical protein